MTLPLSTSSATRITPASAPPTIACPFPVLYLKPGTTIAIRKVINATRGSDDNGPGGAVEELLSVGLEPLINFENHREESLLVPPVSEPSFVSVLVRAVSDDALNCFVSCVDDGSDSDFC